MADLLSGYRERLLATGIDPGDASWNEVTPEWRAAEIASGEWRHQERHRASKADPSKALDLAVSGLEETYAMLSGMPEHMSNQIMRRSLLQSGERVKARILLNLSGLKVREVTGRTVAAHEGEPVRVKRWRSTGTVQATYHFPTRAALGIDPKDKHFYPAALEYGSPKMTPKRYIRDAVNLMETGEHARIALDIRTGIERYATRLAKRVIKASA